MLLNLQRVETYSELADTLFLGLAPMVELGQASLYRAEVQKTAQLEICGSYARSGRIAPDVAIDVWARDWWANARSKNA